MIRALVFIQLACLIGCSSKNEAVKKPDRYLYFTSNFPTGVYWEIVTSFGNKNGNLICKDFSMGDGGLVQSTKYEHYTLKNANDTLKVPLFWTKTNLCGWEMSDLSMDVRGGHLQMPQIYLLKKTTLHERTTKPIPDSLTYVCKNNAEEDQMDCDAENGETESDFILNDTIAISHLRIDLKGF